MRQFLPKMILIFCVTQASILSSRAGLHLERVEGPGMTGGYIKCITQDKKGFIWFGTFEGLFRYDGYEFRSFRNLPGDPGTLMNNNVEFLYPGEDGSLWIGSRGGLSRLDTRSLQVVNYPAAELLSVYSLVAKDDTSFYAGTDKGLFGFSVRSGNWSRIPAFDKKVFIRNLTAGPRDDLYISTHDGIYIYNRVTGASRHLDLPTIPGNVNQLPIAHRSILDARGNIWISTWNAGLLGLDPTTKQLSTFRADHRTGSPTSEITIYDLQADDDGRIWTANSENGLTIFDPRHHTSSSFQLFLDPGKRIPDRVYSLFRDRTGIWWIGTENGIFKSDPYELFLSKIEFKGLAGAPLIRPDLTPLCMLKDRQGCWWMGTYEGLYLFDPATGIFSNYSAAAGIPPHELVNNILEDRQGDLWVAAHSRMIRLIIRRHADGTPAQIFARPSPPLISSISAACLDRKGRLWVGTHRSGVYRWETASSQFIPCPISNTAAGRPTGGTLQDDAPPDKNEIRAFLELRDGTILLGGEHTGLVRFDPSSGIYEEIAAFNRAAGGTPVSISTMALDDRGKIWIGTEGNGLWEMDQGFKELFSYSIRDGLPSVNVPAILPVPDDHIWLITEGGLVDYRPLHKKMKVYGKEAGLIDPYSVFSLCRLDSGTIAAGDMGCLQLVNGNESVKNVTPPPVAITEFKIFDTPYPITGGAGPELAFDQNYFSFSFTALNYTHSSLNRYSYMLEGVDNKWNDAGGRRYVSYANLKEGAYTFKVRACNNEGIWNDQPETLSFSILPPFWRTWWFYLLAAALVASLCYIGWSIDRQHRTSKEQLRNKIARDLHDDIGSTLSGINIFSRIALRKLSGDPDASADLLRRIDQRSEITMEALSDIVWSINTREDKISNVLAKMWEYMGDVLEPLGIRYEFIFEPSINKLQIGMEIRRDIYLIFKEAVHNACKHGKADLIRIELKKEKGRKLAMIISDNGKGFEIQPVLAGNGITNMRERAARIKARFDLFSEPGKGTTVCLSFPIT